jgi:hypothetical protein
MARFGEYANKYKPIQMERRDGILRMRLPTNGGTLHWGEAPLSRCAQRQYGVETHPPGEDASRVAQHADCRELNPGGLTHG